MILYRHILNSKIGMGLSAINMQCGN